MVRADHTTAGFVGGSPVFNSLMHDLEHDPNAPFLAPFGAPPVGTGGAHSAGCSVAAAASSFASTTPLFAGSSAGADCETHGRSAVEHDPSLAELFSTPNLSLLGGSAGGAAQQLGGGNSGSTLPELEELEMELGMDLDELGIDAASGLDNLDLNAHAYAHTHAHAHASTPETLHDTHHAHDTYHAHDTHHAHNTHDHADALTRHHTSHHDSEMDVYHTETDGEQYTPSPASSRYSPSSSPPAPRAAGATRTSASPVATTTRVRGGGGRGRAAKAAPASKPASKPAKSGGKKAGPGGKASGGARSRGPPAPPAARSLLDEPHTQYDAVVDGLFSQHVLRSDPAKFSAFKNQHAHKLNAAQLERIAYLRRKERACVHAAKSRTKRLNAKAVRDSDNSRLRREVTSLRTENAGLRAQLAKAMTLLKAQQ